MLDGPQSELKVFRAEKKTDCCHFKATVKAFNKEEAREMLDSLNMEDFELVDDKKK